MESNKKAPFLHVEDCVAWERWEEANQLRYYSVRVRIRRTLTALDRWHERNSVIIGVVIALGLTAGVAAAVNLELGRPWF